MNKLADPSHPLGIPDLVDEVGGKILHGSKDVGHHLLALVGRLDPLHTLSGHIDHLRTLGDCLAHLRALNRRLNHLHAHDGHLYYLPALCSHLEHLLTLRDQLLCVGVIGNQLGGEEGHTKFDSVILSKLLHTFTRLLRVNITNHTRYWSWRNRPQDPCYHYLLTTSEKKTTFIGTLNISWKE